MKTKENYRHIIGQNIKKYRLAKNFKQEHLGILAFGYPADKAKAAHSYISKLESGRKEPTCSDIIKIADVLGLDCKIFLEDGIKKPSK